MHHLTYTWREPLASQCDRVLREVRSEIQASADLIVSEGMKNVRELLTAYLQDEFGQGREKVRAASPTSLPCYADDWAPGKQIEEPRIGPGRHADSVAVVKQKRRVA